MLGYLVLPPDPSSLDASGTMMPSPVQREFSSVASGKASFEKRDLKCHFSGGWRGRVLAFCIFSHRSKTCI